MPEITDFRRSSRTNSLANSILIPRSTVFPGVLGEHAIKAVGPEDQIAYHDREQQGYSENIGQTGAFGFLEGGEAVDYFEVRAEEEAAFDILEFLVEFQISIKYFNWIRESFFSTNNH